MIDELKALRVEAAALRRERDRLRSNVAAARRECEGLRAQLDGLAKTTNAAIGGRCRCGAKQIGPTRWVVDGHGPWECAALAAPGAGEEGT